jgi:thiol-disulfide isomerase/thioredoxin
MNFTHKNQLIFMLLWAFISISHLSFGQENILYYNLKGSQDDRMILYGLKGGERFALDTVYRQSSGAFVFTGIEQYHPGIYRVYINDSTFTELIFNREDIVLTADIQNILGTMTISKSVENSIMFSYWSLALVIKDSILTLSRKRGEIEFRTHNSNHPEIKKINLRIKQLNDSAISFVDSLLVLHPNLFAPRLLKSYQQPNFDRYKAQHPLEAASLSEGEYYFYHFFDNIDFNDERFLYTKVLYTTLSDYISTFGEPASTANYVAVVDQVMSKCTPESETYYYCLDLFVKTFESSIWEDVMIHIIDSYYLKSNKYSSSQKDFSRKHAEKIKSLRPGQPAPTLLLPDEKGTLIDVLKTPAKAKMIVFYSTECSHCAEAMPSLVELAGMYASEGLQSYGVAIAEDQETWMKEIIKFNMNWTNLSDVKGMGSPFINDYNINATPTIYILADDNVIMAKPSNTDDIHAVVLQLLHNR